MAASICFRDKQREPPLLPDRFYTLIQDKTFTNGADREKIVIPKYNDTFEKVIEKAEKLHFDNLGFGDEEADAAVYLAQNFGSVTDLSLGANNLLSMGMVVTLTNLVKLDLARNKEMSGDIASLRELRNLTDLALFETQVSGDIASLSELRNLTELLLDKTQVSGDIAS